LSYDPVSDLVITGSTDTTIKVWNASAKSAIYTFRDHLQEVAGLKVDYEGQRFVSASFDGTVKIWDMRTWKCFATLVGHQDRCTRVDFTSDRIMSGSFDCSSILWNFIP